MHTTSPLVFEHRFVKPEFSHQHFSCTDACMETTLLATEGFPNTTVCVPLNFMFNNFSHMEAVNYDYELCNNSSSSAAGPRYCGAVRERWHKGWTGCDGCGHFEQTLFQARDSCAVHPTAPECLSSAAGILSITNPKAEYCSQAVFKTQANSSSELIIGAYSCTARFDVCNLPQCLDSASSSVMLFHLWASYSSNVEFAQGTVGGCGQEAP